MGTRYYLIGQVAKDQYILPIKANNPKLFLFGLPNPFGGGSIQNDKKITLKEEVDEESWFQYELGGFDDSAIHTGKGDNGDDLEFYIGAIIQRDAQTASNMLAAYRTGLKNPSADKTKEMTGSFFTLVNDFQYSDDDDLEKQLCARLTQIRYVVPDQKKQYMRSQTFQAIKKVIKQKINYSGL
ncbi:hypothetical protein [Paenibacillus hamazuiensis]|uniref:hypothetical protein n=1 Tax=Paenibacillus hamazuiensis TaxID=2936508 RepID=UPI00200C5240|nr:hypothetical protein [Paenibacillus hamazuiensis]